jgi:hypothetical protein
MDGVGGQDQTRIPTRTVQELAMSGLAATLRAADPGTRVLLKLRDGSEVEGELRDVNGESIGLDDGVRVELRQVERIRLEFGSVARKPKQPEAA